MNGEGFMAQSPDQSVSQFSDLSFDQLYDLYATDVLRVAYYYLGDRQRAEDVTQDVYVRFLTASPGSGPEAKNPG